MNPKRQGINDWGKAVPCPKCGSDKVHYYESWDAEVASLLCLQCGHYWSVTREEFEDNQKKKEQ